MSSTSTASSTSTSVQGALSNATNSTDPYPNLTQLITNTSKDNVYMAVKTMLNQFSQNGTMPDPADLNAALCLTAENNYFSTCIMLLKEGAEVTQITIDTAVAKGNNKLADLLNISRNLINRNSRNFSLLCSVFVKPSRQNDNYVYNLLRAGADPYFQGGIVYRLAIKYRYGTFIGMIRQFCNLAQLSEHALLGAIYDGDAESVTNLLSRHTRFSVAHYRAVMSCKTQNSDVIKAIVDSGCYNFTESDFACFDKMELGEPTKSIEPELVN